MVIQSMEDASPAKWHLAHTTWFFEAFILTRFDPDYRVFDPAFNFLFNSYYEAKGARHPRPKRGLLSRPSLATVMDYRKHVTGAMAGLLDRSPGPEVLTLAELGCQHEEQHQELLITDIKHALSFNPLKPAYREGKPGKAKPPGKLTYSSHPEGIYEIGHGGEGFHFDCEGPRHKIYQTAFKLAERPVTNGEYLEFMADEGYGTPALWLSDGWAWVQKTCARHPLYWRDEDGWLAFTLFGEQPLDLGAAATHLNYYEADAFARWAGARLPTEGEMELAAVASGQKEAAEVWAWTSSAFSPYPGFKPNPGAVGEYNGKFMVNQQVLRGGSLATPKGHWRPSYRNFFYPHSQWQFTGVRLAL